MDTKSDYDDLEENSTDKSSKHRTSKDSKKSSNRREEKDHKSSSKDKDRTRTNTDVKEDHIIEKDRRNGDRDERDKDRIRDKLREKDHDREKYKHKEDREKENDLDNDRGRDKDRGKEKNRERDRIREKERDREKGKEREKYKDRERENDKDALEREKGKERNRDKDRSVDYEKERSRDRDKYVRKTRDEGHDKNKDDNSKLTSEMQRDSDSSRKRKGSHSDEDETRTFKRERNAEDASSGPRESKSDLEDRILKMKEERLKNKSESVPELVAWVNKSRKLEEKKKTEKEKALMLSKVFEEQDNLEHGEIEDKDIPQHTSEDLAGFKVLHGLDKVMEGGAVVLTLKDQNILAGGDINQDVDMLENVEIGEQQRRKEAYQAAGKKTGTYEDKFNDDLDSEKKMLPQYDDSVADEGITLDGRGRFTGEAEKKLEELRKKLEGASANSCLEDLSSLGKTSSDYYTAEEMLQFKKPKKKKSLRKKEKIDLDALEAEAISAGLGDLGSRNDGKRQAMKEEQQKYETEKRSSAYQSAYAKADEASKALRLAQTVPVKKDKDENPYYVDEDDDDLYKSLERARNLELKKKNEEKASGPQAVALLATSSATAQAAEDQNSTSVEPQDKKVVFTEMEEFVWGLQLDEEGHKTDNNDVFMEEDDAPQASDQEVKIEAGVWSEMKDTDKEENTVSDNKKEIVLDNIIHEVPVGKGLSGALKLLKERGTLKETVDWGGRNMDKKKSKLVGIYENDGQKEIRIERTDEFGRIMTPKEAFRMISHKFHGKGPGKMKLEKRQKQFNEELKLKQMKNSDTPSLSVERMREAQAQSKSPYVVISGHVKPGQTSDPRSGFATVEKEHPGGLTPMLGDRKVDYFLGIKRNGPGDMGPPKNPRT